MNPWHLFQRWVDNLVRLQEKRPFSVITVLCFVAFVGSVRLMEEWALGHRSIDYLPGRLLVQCSFYLMCALSYTLAMRVVLRQDWRKTMNVVLIGVFLGIVPPLIDLVVVGQQGFWYEYARFENWKWWIYDPAHHFGVGETAVLWATIALAAVYAWSKTRSVLSTASAAIATYGVVLFNLSVLFTVADATVARASAKAGLPFDMSNWQLGASLVLYLLLNPRLAVGLGRRFNHALPFGLVFLVGAGFGGVFDARIAAYTLLPLLGFTVAIAQNDLFDRGEDEGQGRRAYVDSDDVVFLNVILLALIYNLMHYQSLLGPALLVFFVVSVLYNYPSYRAKAFFPSNLKIEGVWGGTAAFMGVVAAIETPIEVARFKLGRVHTTQLSEAFGWDTVAFVALVFGGWSVVAALKDYKDIRADARGGIQTVYTLAARRGWGLRRVHTALVVFVAVCMLLPAPLLVWADRIPAIWSWVGVPMAVVTALLMGRAPSGRRFEWYLGALNVYLAVLAVLLIRN